MDVLSLVDRTKEADASRQATVYTGMVNILPLSVLNLTGEYQQWHTGIPVVQYDRMAMIGKLINNNLPLPVKQQCGLE